MILRKILSITGRPGLFEIVSQGKNTLIVEDIVTKKRLPVHARDKVVSLGDIAIYTLGDDVPLANVFEAIRKANGGNAVDVKAITVDRTLRDYLAEIYPEYDPDRVHDSDIKKLFVWYNLLVNNGYNTFIESEQSEDNEVRSEAAEDGVAKD